MIHFIIILILFYFCLLLAVLRTSCQEKSSEAEKLIVVKLEGGEKKTLRRPPVSGALSWPPKETGECAPRWENCFTANMRKDRGNKLLKIVYILKASRQKMVFLYVGNQEIQTCMCIKHS